MSFGRGMAVGKALTCIPLYSCTSLPYHDGPFSYCIYHCIYILVKSCIHRRGCANASARPHGRRPAHTRGRKVDQQAGRLVREFRGRADPTFVLDRREPHGFEVALPLS